MALELIPVGNAPANSADFVLSDGEAATLALKGVDSTSGQAVVVIELKDDGGGYVSIDQLSSASMVGMQKVLSAAGTFRLRRVSGICGAFRG